MAIDRSYIDELVRRSDIADVVSQSVELKRRGRTQVGLCPFHNERTPSFVVYPETQSFYCFGCGAGGDVITFVMKQQNLDYVEAVRWLATRAGLALPEESDDTGRLRRRMLLLNKELARFFVERLNSEEGKDARGYLRRRGLADKTIRQFGLGFAPNSFDAAEKFLQGRGFSEEEMVAASVLKKSDKGHTYDVFRNRVMFPILDVRGDVIAFGGRDLGDGKPKYLNSPETLVFKKSKNLFALYLAKQHKDRPFFLGEGYMDVIALHEAGFPTAVASLGTALTEEHVRLISDYTSEVLLCYDGDEAGERATERAIALLSKTNLKVGVLRFEGAKDPDEYIRKFGKDRFEALVAGAGNATEYALDKVKNKYDLALPADRVEYLKEAVNVLAGPIGPTERAVYIGRLAEEANVPRVAIEQQLAQRLKTKERRENKEREKRLLTEGLLQHTAGSGTGPPAKLLAEQQLLAAALRQSSYAAQIATELTEEQFTNPECRRIFAAMRQLTEEGDPVTLTTLSAGIDPKEQGLLTKILAANYEVGFSQQDVDRYLSQLKDNKHTAKEKAQMSAEEMQQYLASLRRTKIKPT